MNQRCSLVLTRMGTEFGPPRALESGCGTRASGTDFGPRLS